MAWSKVKNYFLGYNIAKKQCYFYFELEGDNVVRMIYVTAPEMTALADMFRNEGPVSYYSDGQYFVTAAEKVGEGEVVPALQAFVLPIAKSG